MMDNKMFKMIEYRILRRGYDYYLNNRIIAYKQEDQKHHFKVEGSAIYHVDIDLEKSEMHCDCPYENHCKHEAACLYMLKHGNLDDIKEPEINLNQKNVCLDYERIDVFVKMLHKSDKQFLKYLKDQFESLVEDECFEEYGRYYYDNEDNEDYYIDEFAKELLLVLEHKAYIFDMFLEQNKDNDVYFYDLALRMMEQCDNVEIFKSIEKFYLTNDYRDDVYYETVIRLYGKETYIEKLKSDCDIHRSILEKLLKELDILNDEEELLKYYHLGYHKDLLNQNHLKAYIGFLEKQELSEEYSNVLLTYLIDYYDYELYLKYKYLTDNYKYVLKRYINQYQSIKHYDSTYKQLLDILIKENEVDVIFSREDLLNIYMIRSNFEFFKKYPDFTYNIYFKCIKNSLIVANVNKYQEICEWIFDLNKLTKGDEYIQLIINYIRDNYSNRPSLMKEIGFIRDTLC